MKKTNVSGDAVMFKLGTCKYMMAKTVHQNNSSLDNFGFAMLMYRKLFLCLFSYPFKQLYLTVETGVHLIQLLCI